MWHHVPLDGPTYHLLRLEIYGSPSDVEKLIVSIAGNEERTERESQCLRKPPVGLIGDMCGCLHEVCETARISRLLSLIWATVGRLSYEDCIATPIIRGTRLVTGAELQKSNQEKEVGISTNTSLFSEKEIGSVTENGKEIGRVLLQTPPPISTCSGYARRKAE